MKWSKLKMKWRQLHTNLCQFRLRSLLLFVLAVKLAFVFGIPLRTWYLRYQEAKR